MVDKIKILKFICVNCIIILFEFDCYWIKIIYVLMVYEEISWINFKKILFWSLKYVGFCCLEICFI